MQELSVFAAGKAEVTLRLPSTVDASSVTKSSPRKRQAPRLQDTVRLRNIRLPAAAQEAKRQVREAADAAGIDIRLSDALPDIEVNAAAVELCLTNYLTNAIKYADSEKSERFAEVLGSVESGPDGDEEVVIRVRDNGLGVPASGQQALFQRFFRAHEKTVTGVEGTGLGLSIVRETAEALGGRAWAEFPEGSDGSIFAFSLPVHSDAAGGSRLRAGPIE